MNNKPIFTKSQRMRHEMAGYVYALRHAIDDKRRKKIMIRHMTAMLEIAKVRVKTF